MLRTVNATRYVQPLREGGSLPAIVEADDDGLYVLKFRGAGQGTKALIAELVAGEIGRALGLPVPEMVFVELDPILGRSEPDFEIQALIKANSGLDLGLDFLPGALASVSLSPTLPLLLVPHSKLYLGLQDCVPESESVRLTASISPKTLASSIAIPDASLQATAFSNGYPK